MTLTTYNILAVVVAFAITLTVYYYMKRHPRLGEPRVGNQPPVVKGKITLYGNSIAHGGYVGKDGLFARLVDYPAQKLARMTGLDVTDASINGDTINRLYLTFFSDGHDGEFTVIEGGINDAMAKEPIKAALKRMIEHEIKYGRRVILTGLSHTNRIDIPMRESHNQDIADLADEYRLPFADWDKIHFVPDDDLMDLIHPTDAYSERLYAAVAGEIIQLQLEDSTP